MIILEEISSFILEKIDSVGHLEVLILLCGRPDDAWTAQSVSAELRTNPSLAQQQLDSLSRHGLLRINNNSSYQYGPQNSKLDNLSRQVISLFKEKRLQVINVIYSKPAERVRHLADAFKIRKDE